MTDDEPTATLFELLRTTRDDQTRSLDRIERRLEAIDTRTQTSMSEMRGMVDAHAVQIGALLRWQGTVERAEEARETEDRAWRRIHAPTMVIAAAACAAGLVAIIPGLGS